MVDIILKFVVFVYCWCLQSSGGPRLANHPVGDATVVGQYVSKVVVCRKLSAGKN
jgi:hypothetical protein